MTKVVEFESRASIERQAREWLVRLDADESLSDTELEELRAWMNANPSHREELTRISKFWSDANVLTELAVPLKRIGLERRPRWPRMLPAFASAVLASIFLTSLWLQRSDGAVNGTYGTAIGQQQTLSLRDGSSIQLNTDSQVQIDYSDRVRRIRLLRGEALFSVAHDRNRPFDVHAANAIVKAVGTAFVIDLVGSDVAVTVTEGVVDLEDVGSASALTAGDSANSVRPQRKLVQLRAGQMSTFNGETEHVQVRKLAEAELQRRMAWREGYLVFSGEPLSEVVKQVNRYSPVKLAIADPNIESVAIGGRFRIGDLDAVLGVLDENFAIQSARIDERNIRLESAHRR